MTQKNTQLNKPKRLCSRLTALWRYINFVLLLLLLITQQTQANPNFVILIRPSVRKRAGPFQRPSGYDCRQPEYVRSDRIVMTEFGYAHPPTQLLVILKMAVFHSRKRLTGADKN